MDIQFGLETEYGITRLDPDNLDVVAESIALVRSATAPGVRMCWDYRLEDPHLDARGFRVSELRQDVDEANYFAQDVSRPLTFAEIKSDLVLRNGGRFYNDHAHPEYCTPECSTLLELLQQDHAGDEVVMACAEALSEGSDNPIQIYKNNTDFLGHSYGCHENYLIPRSLPWPSLVDGILAFFVTRQVFCGAGKYGIEDEDRFVGPGFQISQRSDFFSVIQSVDTMQKRPLVNTRDEPHADPDQWRRFHVIIGDANLSPFATWLKVGTTALVLRALIQGVSPDSIPRLADPLGDLRAISSDRTWSWDCQLVGDRPTNAVDIQRAYLSLVRESCEHLEGDWQRVGDEWEVILDDLERDPMSTSDRLDWSAKRNMVERFRREEDLRDDDPWLRSLDLAYHHLDREQGLFPALLSQGAIRLPYTHGKIARHGLLPPESTRAAVRGACIEKWGPRVIRAQWDSVALRGETSTLEVDLRSIFRRNEVDASLAIIRSATRVEDLQRLSFVRIV